MRILIVAESRTYHAQRWSASLARRGHEVWLLSRSLVPIHAVNVVPLKTPPRSLRYPGRWRTRYEKYVLQTVREIQPDVLHVHFLNDYPITRNVLGNAKLMISTWGSDIVTDESQEQESEAARKTKVELLHRADQVTATTHFLARETAKYADLDLADICVIPFGVDLNLFRPREKNENPASPRVLFLKHLCPKYGPHYLLEALPRILATFPDLRVSMVGEGPMLAALQDQASRLCVARAIEWHGAVCHKQVPRLLAEHDVYVMPSIYRSETFGVSAIEAQAAEVPVVCSDLPGVREVAENGVGGILVPPRDPHAIADAVIRLVQDRRLNRQMGRAGRDFVAQRFNWQDNVSAMEDVYRRLAG